jgi:hypothetical protein
MEVYLIRHTTPKVDKGICYGQSDISCTDSFMEEAARIIKNLPERFDAVYSSPLIRCSCLAENLAKPDSILIDSRLMEVNFGLWEMKKWDDIDKSLLDVWMKDFVVMTLKVNGKTCCSTRTLPEGSSEWIPFSTVYTTKSDETRIEISIVDEILTQIGNDVGLDNIVFKELPADTTITGELIEIGETSIPLISRGARIFVFRNNDGSNAYINICFPELLLNKGFFVIGKKYKIACTKTRPKYCSAHNPKNYTNLLFEQSIVGLD